MGTSSFFFDQLFLCRWLSVSWFDVAVVVDLWSTPKKEENSTVVGGISAKYVAGTTYIREPIQIQHYFDQVFVVGCEGCGYDVVVPAGSARAKKGGKEYFCGADFGELCRWYYLHT